MGYDSEWMDKGRVSILTHPKRWVLPECGVRRNRPAEPVSILTHPKRWVLPRYDGAAPAAAAGFNPHPPEKVGATLHGQCPSHCLMMFQSSPTRKGGCYGDGGRGTDLGGGVSILTHPKRWVLRVQRRGFHDRSPRFNPHPPEKVGATTLRRCRPCGCCWFQSSPTRKGGCYPARAVPVALSDDVSILTHPKRWVLRPIRRHRAAVHAGFNPHPPEKVGATSKQ